MKKAVIIVGNKQFLVTEGDELEVDRLTTDKKLNLKPLLVIEDQRVRVGKPNLSSAEVVMELGDEILGEKVKAIRYKAKKRVKKIRGHRQQLVKAKITKISL